VNLGRIGKIGPMHVFIVEAVRYPILHDTHLREAGQRGAKSPRSVTRRFTAAATFDHFALLHGG